MTANSLTNVDLPSLPKIASGKVRELFSIDNNTLLFVTSDRISAFDIVMNNGVPQKGSLLTMLSRHWFNVLPELVPDLHTHFLTTDLPVGLSDRELSCLTGRTMQVRKCKVFPLECIVRGYITGSVWNEYVTKGTVHGIPLPRGLQQCAAIPGGPIYTPSTKAPPGQHDENIHPNQAIEIIGEKYARCIEELALKIFKAGQDYAAQRGIIIADTKFEFGLDESTDKIVLIDEVLTPDSSRMWLKNKYEPGREQESLDKEPLRNWLRTMSLEGKEGVNIPDDVALATSQRYKDVFTLLTGQSLNTVLRD
ncbi:putative phosphoribosylaminoimidazole-succinocarboxamide synthase [Nemania abortiva]|nr:putative phosphoribosylaminoimidazole-succinocarboxamide synthase [Nemania abortiva]